MGGSTFEGNVSLNGATVEGGAFLRNGATFKGEVDLVAAKIGSGLDMGGSTFEGDVSLNGATVEGSAYLRNGATFKGKVDLVSAKIGSALDMGGSTFEGDVSLNGATVEGGAFLRNGATFKGKVDLGSAKIGSSLDMEGSTFEGDVNLNRATVEGSAYLRNGATFKGKVDLGSAKIGSGLFMGGSTFEGKVDLVAAKIGSGLVMGGSTFGGDVDLTACTVTGIFLLSLSEATSARWLEGTSLTLRNAHVGAFQDWWLSKSANAWPMTYQLEGFTYGRLGTIIGEEEAADMLDRPVTFYIQWLEKDSSSSNQPYKQLAGLFREAGEPYKSTDILYAARERQRRKAWSTVDDCGHAKKREWLRALGLSALRATIGYGLGNRYFLVIGWVAGLALLGAIVLVVFGSHSPASWPRVYFASLDQLLPIITLDKAHDTLIFGNTSAKPPVAPQPYCVLIYFYLHEIAGWVLGSFLVAGLAGLTQRD